MHLIAPIDLKQQFPLSPDASRFIEESRLTIKRILEGQDSRLLIIVGPCSIHDVAEGLEYARQLKKLALEVQDSCFLIMRAYVEKPRTRKEWKGLVHDPFLNGTHDIPHGLVLTRSFLANLAEMGVPAAMEFLTPHLAPYVEDLITWGCIGARTSSSQIHRLLASHLPMPVGFKNTIDGNTECAVNGVHVAQSPHSFMHICDSGKIRQINSSGNLYTHVVLRGSTRHTNYDESTVQKVAQQLQHLDLAPKIMIDCSHGNCQGHHLKQKEVFQAVLEQIQNGNSPIFGVMLESHLEAGKQKIPPHLSDLLAGVSVTDPCLSFSETAQLVSSVSSSIAMSFTQS